MLDTTRFYNAVAARVASVSARLARTTPRERVLLGALVAAAFAYAPVAALDWRSSQETRYVDALTARADARAERARATRLAQDSQDVAVIEDMRSWGIKASNIDVARVTLEQHILASATEAELTGLRIATDAEAEAIGPVAWLGADIQADLRWGPTFTFLDLLAGWPEGFRVRSFSYEQLNTPMTVLGGGMGAPPVTARVTIGIAVPVEIMPVSDGTP